MIAAAVVAVPRSMVKKAIGRAVTAES